MMKRLAIDLIDLTSQSGTRAGTSMHSSQTLISRARSGDDEAFRLIFERYTRPVIGFIYNMVGQRDLAEELARVMRINGHPRRSEDRRIDARRKRHSQRVVR